jgi:hypothetical protein
VATGAINDTAHNGLESHEIRCEQVPHREASPLCLRALTPSILRPVADVVSRRVVVSSV